MALQNSRLPILVQPLSVIVVSGVTSPRSSAARAVTILNVEPVGYVDATARLMSGAPRSSLVSSAYLEAGTG